MGIKSPKSQNTLIWAQRLIQMEVSKFPNNYLQRKQEDQYLVQNVFLNLTSFQLLYAINFLMPYFFQYYDTALRYGVLTTELMLRNNNNYYNY